MLFVHWKTDLINDSRECLLNSMMPFKCGDLELWERVQSLVCRSCACTCTYTLQTPNRNTAFLSDFLRRISVYYVYYVYKCFVCILCTRVQYPQRTKEGVGPPETELQVALIIYLLFKRSRCSSPLNHSSLPSTCNLLQLLKDNWLHNESDYFTCFLKNSFAILPYILRTYFVCAYTHTQ